MHEVFDCLGPTKTTYKLWRETLLLKERDLLEDYDEMKAFFVLGCLFLYARRMRLQVVVSRSFSRENFAAWMMKTVL